MFYGCEQLENIIFGERFDTSNVTDINNMFRHCTSLKYLDLSSFDTSRVSCMQEIFSGCESLEYIIEQFNYESVAMMYIYIYMNSVVS